jgi:hypothetical protein
MKVGDIVCPTSESHYNLRTGCGWYSEAVVVSLEPFILVSTDTDMMWSATIKLEYFEVVCKAFKKLLKKCMKRLDN